MEEFERFLDRHQTLFAPRRPVTQEQSQNTVEWDRSDPHVARLLLSRMERKLNADENAPLIEFYRLAMKLLLLVAENELGRSGYYDRLYEKSEESRRSLDDDTPCLPYFLDEESEY